MSVSVDEVLGATQYRSLSRAGRMTESLTSKSRDAFHGKVSKQRVERETATPVDASGSPTKKTKPGVSPLKLLSVAEVATVDSTEMDKRVHAALPSELADDRVDALCSSGRDHPEVKAKAEVIVALEQEIAFHSALADFHGGVETAASKQSADAAAKQRMVAERQDAERRAASLGLQDPAAAASPATDAAAATPTKGKKKRDAGGTSLLARAATPSGAVGMSSLVNATAANRSSTPAFAYRGSRFGKEDGTRAPPVGHYRPRHGVVEQTTPEARFPKSKRVLNPPSESPYKGDRMSPEERELAIIGARSPSRRAGTAPAAEASLTTPAPSPAKGGTAAPTGFPASPNASSAPGAAGALSPAQAQANAATAGNPPATAPAASSPGRASPCFRNRGRAAPVMARGSTPMPQESHVRGGKRGAKKGRKSPSRESQAPAVVNEELLRPRGPSAALRFDQQVSRAQRERTREQAAAPADKLVNHTSMPLRSGSKVHNRGGGAFSFDGYSTREQEVSRTEGRFSKEQQAAQNYYDRAALDKIRFKRTATPNMDRGLSREQYKSGMPLAASLSADAYAVQGGPPVEPPRKHTPMVNMDQQTDRPPIEAPYNELSYEPEDAVTKAHTRTATIGTSPGHGDPVSPSRKAKEDTKPRHLASHEELDSPQVRRRLARSIDFGRSVSRDQRARIAERGRGTDDEAPPIDSAKLDKAYEFMSPHRRGDPKMTSHVSRAKRDAVAAPAPLTTAIDLSLTGDSPARSNLRLGYVAMGKMTERDRHGGNHFANESRTITRLFDKQHGGGEAGSPGRKKSPAPAASS